MIGAASPRVARACGVGDASETQPAEDVYMTRAQHDTRTCTLLHILAHIEG